MIKMQIFFPYGKVPSNYGSGRGGGSNSSHGSNNYQPSTSGVAQHGNHNHVGTYNWCGG
jgi:hypothetical protein